MTKLAKYFFRMVQPADKDKPETLLWAAAWEGRPEEIPGIVGKGVDINARCTAGWAALHRAAIRRHHDVVKALLDCGADPCVKDFKNQTPLHFAASRGLRDICETLLLAGTDPAAKDDYGKTAADLARERGEDQLADMIQGYLSLRHSRRLKAVMAGRSKVR